jgi:hypothetical protein
MSFMTRSRRLSPLSAILASACPALTCACVAAEGGTPRHGPWVPQTAAGAPLHVLVPAPDGPRHAHLGWPKIVRTPKGTLVLGCLAGREHTVDGCPAVSLSRDDGKTFSKPAMLAEFDRSMRYRHSGNIALGVAPDGALVYLAMAFTGNERNTIYGWRSEDEGETWNAVDTSRLADNRSGSVFGAVIDVPGLGFMVFGHYRVGATPSTGIWYAVSPDNGKTWGDPVQISPSKLFEPAFTFASGRLVGLIRNDPAGHYWQLVSDDLGKTWQEGESPVGPGQRGLPSPFIGHRRDDPSRLLALLTHRCYRPDELGYVELWEADAKTLDWRRVRKLVTIPPAAGGEGKRPDFGYPWMTQISETEWLLVLYCGIFDGANSLWGTTITIEK